MKRALILFAASMLRVPPADAQATAQDATVKLLAELANATARRASRARCATSCAANGAPARRPAHRRPRQPARPAAGQRRAPRILLMAHMDEVGFLVRAIDEHGFVYMNPVGGYIDQSVLTQRYTS